MKKKIILICIGAVISIASVVLSKKIDTPVNISGNDNPAEYIPVRGGVKSASAVVGYIVDGDTFSAKVRLDTDVIISVRVRMINIDTPEIHGECVDEIKMAIAAKDRLGQLIPVGTTVYLSEIKDDKYLGRIDARVLNADGADVGEIMISEKQARRYSGGKRQPWCK